MEQPLINYRVRYTAKVNGNTVTRTQIIAAASHNSARLLVSEWLFSQNILHMILGCSTKTIMERP
jgi:hypothetical protein